MANKNRKNQGQGSVKNTELNKTNNQKNTTKNSQKENTADVQFIDTDKSSNLKSEGKTQTGKDHSFQTGRFLELVNRYKRYLAAGALFVAMVVVLAKCTGPVTEKPEEPVTDEQQENTGDLSEEFEIDAIPEVNQLIGDYYTAHAAGDVAVLEKLAKPISDTEKSFIKLNSEYVEAYNNISCYTKSGLQEGEYIVSVYVEIKYKDVNTQAPGLDRFYLRTDENGALYIDNAYSQFNQSNMEVSTEADVQALLNEYEQAEDFLTLWSNVQKKFEDALESDAELKQMANETIPNALAAWAESLVQPGTDVGDASESGESTEQGEDEKPDDNKDDTEEPDDEKPEDDGKSDADGKAKTAYAMDGINLRKGPSTDADIVTQIMLGSKLKIYPDTQKDGWVKATFKGKSGYVKREFVTTKKSKVPSSAEQKENENKPAKALPEGAEITLTDTVNVRVSMSETADKVGVAAPGDVVKVIMSYAEGWTKVEWNGQTGYMMTDLIK